MRRNDTIRRTQQWIIFGNRLCGHDIQSSGTHLSGFQRTNKILLIDELSATVIEKNDAIFHFANGVRTDHLPRMLEKRTMQRDHICSRIQFLDVYILANLSMSISAALRLSSKLTAPNHQDNP